MRPAASRPEPSAIKVEFKSHDDESQVVRVQELYGRLITQDKAQFLFGPVSSGLNAMAAFVSEENGKVMLSTAVDPKIFRLGNRNLFQVTSPASRAFAGALAVLKSRNPKTRIALVYQGRSVYPRGGAGDARSRQGRGADGGARRGLQPDRRRLRSDRRTDPHVTGRGACWEAGISPTAWRWCGRCASMKPALKWLTLLAPPDAPAFADLGDAALGVTAPAQWSPQVVYKPDVGPTAQVFVRRFTDKFKARRPSWRPPATPAV